MGKLNINLYTTIEYKLFLDFKMSQYQFYRCFSLLYIQGQINIVQPS